MRRSRLNFEKFTSKKITLKSLAYFIGLSTTMYVEYKYGMKRYGGVMPYYLARHSNENFHLVERSLLTQQDMDKHEETAKRKRANVMNRLANKLPEWLQGFRELHIRYYLEKNEGAQFQKNEATPGKRAIYYRGESLCYDETTSFDVTIKTLFEKGRVPLIYSAANHNYKPIEAGYLLPGLKVLREGRQATFTSGLVALSASLRYAKGFAGGFGGVLLITVPKEFIVPASRSAGASSKGKRLDGKKAIIGNEYEYVLPRLHGDEILAAISYKTGYRGWVMIDKVYLNEAALEKHNGKIILDKQANGLLDELFRSENDNAHTLMRYLDKQQQCGYMCVMRKHDSDVPENIISAYLKAVTDAVRVYKKYYAYEKSRLFTYGVAHAAVGDLTVSVDLPQPKYTLSQHVRDKILPLSVLIDYVYFREHAALANQEVMPLSEYVAFCERQHGNMPGYERAKQHYGNDIGEDELDKLQVELLALGIDELTVAALLDEAGDVHQRLTSEVKNQNRSIKLYQ